MTPPVSAFDFDHAVKSPFRMQPGLRRLAVGAAQLTPNAYGSRHLREKLAVLSTHPLQALQIQPAFDPSFALNAVAEQAAREHPRAWAIDATRWNALVLGWSVDGDAVLPMRPDDALHAADIHPEIGACLRALPPRWRAAGLLALAFAEDFAIVDGDRATLPWLAVALPSHWSPQAKVGRHFAEVHAPVADNRVLLAAGDHLMRMVTGPERWERFVWTLTADPRLNQHPAQADPAGWPGEAAADAEQLAATAWFRTERQTFIPLPEMRQAVFTILVQTQPLAQVVTDAVRARGLHDALSTMSAAVRAYRGLTTAQPRLLQWLESRMQPCEPDAEPLGTRDALRPDDTPART